MTVRSLIDRLELVKDKSVSVFIPDVSEEAGTGCVAPLRIVKATDCFDQERPISSDTTHFIMLEGDK